ncbi:hypothetical protein PF008_g4887 [Phytophthora fragariae]|uniref:Uncharacterized protein n=1 Tax=Phytophthora fragariae TaxID=53985 RepID=A0A6G0S9Y5_9STRA|nr:hypothetical protein PF008_g4887 [Phytophthora fragariae]
MVLSSLSGRVPSLQSIMALHSKNPFDWMDMISLQGKTNFFEKRVGEYSNAGMGVAAEEQLFTLDADF